MYSSHFSLLSEMNSQSSLAMPSQMFSDKNLTGISFGHLHSANNPGRHDHAHVTQSKQPNQQSKRASEATQQQEDRAYSWLRAQHGWGSRSPHSLRTRLLTRWRKDSGKYICRSRSGSPRKPASSCTACTACTGCIFVNEPKRRKQRTQIESA